MARRTRYRRHTIRTVKCAQEWSALAARTKDAVRPTQFGPTEEAAILAVKAELDSFISQQRARRGSDGFPTVEETRWALTAVKMTPAQRAMLIAHFWAPENIMTATELAEAGGYDSYVSANSQYGMLGRNLSEELEWEPPLIAGHRTWTNTLATGADDFDTSHDESDEHWRWRLRPEIVDALKVGDVFENNNLGATTQP